MKRNWKWKILHTVLERRIGAQLIKKLQIKSKTVMSWCLRKKKEGIFVPFILFEVDLCYTSMYGVWNTFQDIHTFIYIKKLIHRFLFRVLKALKTFSLSLIHDKLYTEHFLICYEIFYCCAYHKKIAIVDMRSYERFIFYK